mgnify:FL=1
MGQTIAETSPVLGPIPPGPEGLAEAARQGRPRLSATVGAERAGMAQELPVNATAPLRPGGAHPRERFEAYLAELAEAGRKGYNVKGIGRDAPSGAVARRERSEITRDILKLLEAENPGLAAQFRASQGAHAQDSEILRALQSPKVLGVRGFHQGKMQEVVNQRLKQGGKYDPAVLKTLFRGGTPPKGDIDLTLPLWGRAGGAGMSLPLFLTKKAGPGAQIPNDPLLALILPWLRSRAEAAE